MGHIGEVTSIVYIIALYNVVVFAGHLDIGYHISYYVRSHVTVEVEHVIVGVEELLYQYFDITSNQIGVQFDLCELIYLVTNDLIFQITFIHFDQNARNSGHFQRLTLNFLYLYKYFVYLTTQTYAFNAPVTHIGITDIHLESVRQGQARMTINILIPIWVIRLP